MHQLTKAAVMIIGGAEDKIHGREILRTFFERSGGTNAKIVILPCASREPGITGGRYVTIFKEMGTENIEVADIQQREQCEDPAWHRLIENCTGVFITGGDQLRLCSILADTALMNTVRTRAQLGQMTLGGTSAGAAVMGHHMIAGGGSGESPNRSLVDMATGLGIVPELLVDQHFHNRNRMARLMSAVSMHPDRLGMGVDEDTCALIETDGTLQALGRGLITILDPAEMTHTNESHIESDAPLSLHGIRLYLLAHGDRYDLRRRHILPVLSRS